MIPHSFIFLDILPLTPNGKIDRLALPEPPSIRMKIDTKYIEPRTPTERLIAEIWQDVLKIDKIGIHDNFFSIGGDSLTAIQILGHLRHFFSINLPLANFFDNPTIADIDIYLNSINKNDIQKYEQIKPNLPQKKYPLSFIQEGFWFYHQLEPRNVFYNIASNKIVGVFDKSLYQKVLNTVISRHNALRMIFKDEDGSPYAEVMDSLEIDVPVIDLSNLAPSRKDTEMMRISREEISRPFDLENGPLIRAYIFKYAEEEHVIFTNMHHIVTDGWSIDVLLSEISNLYKNYLRNPHYQLAMPEIQYSDYILWQRNQSNKELINQQKTYWKEKLSGNLPVLNFKPDKIRPELITYKGGIITFTVDEATTEKLKQLGKKYRSTLYMVLLSIYKTLLYRYSQQEDIIIGSPIAGRGHHQVENIIGCFVNTLAIRTKFTGQMKFTELLKEVRTACLEAFSNSAIPFDSLVAELNPNRDISRPPIFQAMMTMQDKPANLLDLPGLSISDAGVINDLAPYDLSLIIWVESNLTTFYVEYYADIFEKATIAQMMEHYRNIMFSILENPEQDLNSISILKSDEKDALWEKWSKPEHGLKYDESVKALLAEKFGNCLEILQVFVLDNNFDPVPSAFVGTLYVAAEKLQPKTDLTEPLLIKKGLQLYSCKKKAFYTKGVVQLDDNEKSTQVEQKINKFVEPESETEKLIAEVWQKILHKDKISVNDKFFEIGGNSLMLVEILKKINTLMEKDLLVIDLFKYPTIASLAAYVQQQNDSNTSETGVDKNRIEKQRQALNSMSRLRKKS